MKICYLANNAIPANVASALQIVKMCEAFSINGNEVLLICPGTKKIKANIFEFYDVKKKFSIKKLNMFKNFPLGIRYYLFSAISIIYSLNFKADIYITRNFFTSFLLTVLRKRNILELHHDINIESRIVRFIAKSTKFFNFKSLIKIIAITKSVKNYYKQKFNINESKFLISPSGSSLEKRIYNYPIKNKKLNIGYFGSVYKSRGIEIILKLSKLDNKNNYYIYGDLSKYKNIKNVNYNRNLFITEYLPYKKISKELEKMDILLMPYSDKATAAGDVGNIIKFTSPLKLFDYLTAGRIIMCSNISVIREVINDKNAIFVKNFSNAFSWKIEIEKIKNLLQKRIIFSKNNYKLGQKYILQKRAKKILKGL